MLKLLSSLCITLHLLLLINNIKIINGFGAKGHSIIGYIAEKIITEQTFSKIKDLLGNRRLSDYAPKADQWDHAPGNAEFKACHYINIAGDLVNLETDCPSNCLIKCMESVTENLIKTDVSCTDTPFDGEEFDYGQVLCDLALITHYVGDIHQPLHVAAAETKGGNLIPLDIKISGIKAKNLHQLWDSGLLEYYLKKEKMTWQMLAENLVNNIDSESLKQKIGYKNEDDFLVWANEMITRSIPVYQYETKNNRAIIDQKYFENVIELVRTLLLYGGIRLGTLLNEVYAEKHTPIRANRFFSFAVNPTLEHESHEQYSTELVLYATPINQKAYRVLVTAKLANIHVEWKFFEPGVTNETLFWKNKMSFGTNFGMLSYDGVGMISSNEISYYIASLATMRIQEQLLGTNSKNQGQIRNYLALTHEIENNYAALIYPIMGLKPWDIEEAHKSIEYFNIFMKKLDVKLGNNKAPYLINDVPSLADIAMASSLLPLYKYVFDDEFRNLIPFATSWFERIVNSYNYIKILQLYEPSLLTKENKFKMCEKFPSIPRECEK